MAEILLLKELSGLDLEAFARLQLGRSPLDRSRKRVEELAPGRYSIGCRTWKLLFELDEDGGRVAVYDLQSNYREDELAPGADDPYQDKDFHRNFLNHGLTKTKNRL